MHNVISIIVDIDRMPLSNGRTANDACVSQTMIDSLFIDIIAENVYGLMKQNPRIEITVQIKRIVFHIIFPLQK